MPEGRSGTVAGSAGSNAAVGGAVDTVVLNKLVSTYMDNVKNNETSRFKNVDVISNTYSDLSISAGSLGIGGKVGVGGTVSTVVIGVITEIGYIYIVPANT